MEENFDIIQTINELEELQTANTRQLEKKINEENFTENDDDYEYEVLTLRKNMQNNQIYLDNIKQGRIKNQEEKKFLTKKLF